MFAFVFALEVSFVCWTCDSWLHWAKLTLNEHATQTQNKHAVSNVFVSDSTLTNTPAPFAQLLHEDCIGQTGQARQARQEWQPRQAEQAGQSDNGSKLDRTSVRHNSVYVKFNILDSEVCVLEPISNASEHTKYLFYQAKSSWQHLETSHPTNLSITEISTSASDCLVLQSETKAHVQTWWFMLLIHIAPDAQEPFTPFCCKVALWRRTRSWTLVTRCHIVWVNWQALSTRRKKAEQEPQGEE